MQLEHSFTVPLGVEDAYVALLDVEQVVSCMPGAALDTLDGDDFTGSVKVKLGPIALTYKGKASLVEKDAEAHRVVMSARGRDARGNGTAAARVTAQLSPDGPVTRVDVVTDLDITGKPAQFGRGVMVDVGNKLIGEFASRLAGTLGTPSGADGETVDGEDAPPEQAPGSDSPQPAEPRRIAAHAAQDDAVDLLGSAGPAVAKRLAPPLLALLLVVLFLRRRRSR